MSIQAVDAAPASARSGRRRRALTLLGAFAVSACVGLLGAAAAGAHAELVGTVPASGATVSVQPPRVIFRFNQAVGGTAGAVRVYDAQGAEVDDLDVGHPNGQEHSLGVGLKPGLPAGTYTATYRVISADTHIVFGGLVFVLGHPSASSTVTVAGLISRGESGEVTKIAFGVVRSLDYLTLALMAGGLAFLALVWPPALAAAGDQESRAAAARAFRGRARRLLCAAIVLGLLVSVLGVLLQGASASGESLWNATSSRVVEGTLETRFGWVWGVRALVWLGLAAALAATPSLGGEPAFPRRGAARRDGGGGPETGAARRDRSIDSEAGPLRAGPVTPGLLAMGAGALYLIATPALAGHASVESPRGVFFPSDVIHVGAGSVWVGGICFLLLALPAATRRLPAERRGAVLFAALARFSPLALGAVVAIALTGVLQAYIDVRSLSALFDTTYGLLILAKTVMLIALIGLGWLNRTRILPALERIAGAAAATGAVGRLARRSLRGELALMAAVFAVTAALISYAPPIDASDGPFAVNTKIGAALLEMTVEPASVGANSIHLYLIDARTGAQYTATKELTASAKLPAKHIGPLPLHPTLAGPGHYVFNSAVLSPAGTWQIEIRDRTSEFEQSNRVIEVPIR